MSRVYKNELYWLEADYGKTNFIQQNEAAMEQSFINKYWTDLINKDLDNRLVINGVHYTHGGISKSPEKWRGMSGKRFKIKMLDGTIVETNDLWHQGTIPEEFREFLPNNAEFIKE